METAINVPIVKKKMINELLSLWHTEKGSKAWKCFHKA